MALMGAGALFAEDGYIASTTNGTIYSINTGYKIKPTTGIYADFEFLARTADVFPDNKYQQFVFEATGRGTARFYINGSLGAGQLAWNFTTNALWTSTSVTMVPGTRYQMSVDAYTRTAWLDVEGTRRYNGSIPASAVVPNYTDTIKLFSNNSANGNAAMMKLYRFTITESGETVHDYVPAIKGGIVGMYDRTTGEFIYDVRNSPKEVFTYGGDILELEDDAYIENTGAGAINTRFYLAPDAKVEVDYALVEMLPLQARVFGADLGADLKGSFYINGSGNMSFGIGDEFKSWATSCATNLYRHRAVMDVANDKAYFITRFATNWTGSASGLGASITTTATRPIALLGNPNNTSAMAFAGTHYCKAKIYGFKCWKNGNLVHDYVPCVRGGIPGFKDLIDGAFVTSEAPADLRAGGKGLVFEDEDGYISSSGNNYTTGFRYIDTGYTVTPHTRVELDYAPADNYPTSGYIGNHDWYLFEALGSNRFDTYFNNSGMGWCGCGLTWQKYNGVMPPNPATSKDVRRTAIVDNHTGFAGVITAGFTNVAANVTAATDSQTYGTLKLASNSAGSTGYGAIKIFGLKIYESGSLVRNYEPYVKDGVAGLRDTGTGGFIAASGRVAFTAGGNIASNDRSDAYLEASRTQAINTGYLMKGSQSRIECDFAYVDCTTNSTGTTNYQQRPFGQDSGGGLFYSMYINGSGQFRFGIGNGSTFNISDNVFGTADTVRHTAILDGKNSVAKLVTNGVTNSYDYSSFAHNNNSTWPMGIFATPTVQNASAWRNGSIMKLYSLRIYENDELLHEYIPYKKGNVLGLYDTVDKVVKTDARNSATPFKIGGMGVEGVERWIVQPQNTKLTRRNKDSGGTLSANASGAISYKWTKNGADVEGGADGDLTVAWNRHGATDTYTVTPVYDVYGVETEGEPVPVTVVSLPAGTALSIR